MERVARLSVTLLVDTPESHSFIRSVFSPPQLKHYRSAVAKMVGFKPFSSDGASDPIISRGTCSSVGERRKFRSSNFSPEMGRPRIVTAYGAGGRRFESCWVPSLHFRACRPTVGHRKISVLDLFSGNGAAEDGYPLHGGDDGATPSRRSLSFGTGRSGKVIRKMTLLHSFIRVVFSAAGRRTSVIYRSRSATVQSGPLIRDAAMGQSDRHLLSAASFVRPLQGNGSLAGSSPVATEVHVATSTGARIPLSRGSNPRGFSVFSKVMVSEETPAGSKLFHVEVAQMGEQQARKSRRSCNLSPETERREIVTCGSRVRVPPSTPQFFHAEVAQLVEQKNSRKGWRSCNLSPATGRRGNVIGSLGRRFESAPLH